MKYNENVTCIILAAGHGTRMHSSKPKTLQKVGGLPMLAHILKTTKDVGISDIRIASSQELEAHQEFVNLKQQYNAESVIQKERLGTAHATLYGAQLSELKQYIIVLYGDCPLITPQTINNMLEVIDNGDKDIHIGLLGFYAKDPHGYGRIIMENGDVTAILEQKELVDENKIHDSHNLCNSGIMILRQESIIILLKAIMEHKESNEFYLTRAIARGLALNLRSTCIIADEEELLGVNDKKDMASAELAIQKRRRASLLNSGVIMLAPDTVHIGTEVFIASDVEIHQNVIIGDKVTIEEGSRILPFSVLENCLISKNTTIGPFAHIRPESTINENAKIGSFVEIKASNIGACSKVSHLSYVGDADIADNVNIGAGTVFCNYDGHNKHKSTVQEGAFIGSNTSIIAPCTIGANAIIGAGTTVTKDVRSGTTVIRKAPLVEL